MSATPKSARKLRRAGSVGPTGDIADDLFDHLVGGGEQRRRHFEAEYLCGPV